MRLFPTLLSALVLANLAPAKVINREVAVAGVTVHYTVVLPTNFDPSQSYPAVLAFPPGNQDMNMVRTTLIGNWSREAQRRGYIVVIPAAPDGQSFNREGARVFPEFLDKLLADYKIRDNKFHIAGMSAGGISAFRVAASHPRYFLSVTGFPGYLRDAPPEGLNALAGLCIYMHVGELDERWVAPVRRQASDLKAKGYAVRLTVEKGEPHVIGALSGAGAVRLFEEIEEESPGCAK